MMKIKLYCAAFGAVMALFTSCSTSKPMVLNDLSGKWDIVAVDGKKVAVSNGVETPYLGFDVVNGNLTGSTGCNNIMGAFSTTLPAGNIDFGKVASTRMACPDMTLEQDILRALGNVKSYKGAGSGKVELCAASGSGLIVLRKAEADLSVKDLAGTWNIIEISDKPVSLPEGGQCEITFNMPDNTFSCSTGCNILGGSFQSGYTDFRFDLATATLMSCPDMSVEDAVKSVLPRITSFGKLGDGRIGFYSSDNALLMVISH